MSDAVLFPGQGSQSAGMADAWTRHPTGAATLREASDAMGRDVVAGCHDPAALATTSFVQPALLACGVAGQSLGEFAAVVAADAAALPAILELVVVRGEAMQAAGEARPGAMTALLGLGAEDAQALVDEVRGEDVLVVANENSPAQVVASGSAAAVDRLEALAKQRKTRAVRLPVAGAFHSELMRPAVEPVLEVLGRIELRDPAFPVAENVTGDLVTDAATLRELLGRQVVSPVRWDTGIHALATAGATRFVEAGTGDVLTKLMKRIEPEATAVAVGSPEAAAALTVG